MSNARQKGGVVLSRQGRKLSAAERKACKLRNRDYSCDMDGIQCAPQGPQPPRCRIYQE